ncbi:ankyrin repeat-containing domain protein [Stachybotrys elegans]|uniref:Ankyrin repeat-containing domain protein n=1 Tax=Stachybotrys elegans TaxID=80388 RepID=A0A8K0WMS0_9HYPO|nr:ankyrin repeat-containing domain protein [Stachybotrys elegans]
MDGLSVAASIAGLVSLADMVFRTTTTYARGVKGARTEIQSISRELQSLSSVLHTLSLVAFDLELQEHGTGDPSFRAHQLFDCQQTLRKLDSGLQDVKKSIGSTSRFEALKGRLKWPFSSPETHELLQELQRHKQTIDLALAAESLARLKLCLSRQGEIGGQLDDLGQTTKKILDIQTRVILDEKKKDVLKFFMKVDPTPEFQTNKQLRHPMTGLWLTEGPEFGNWYDNSNSKLWLSGIPGAGKSVLAASFIEECLTRNGDKSGTAVGYFFCNYRNAQTQKPLSILSALAIQLARQNDQCFDILETYYEELERSRLQMSEPSETGLLRAISSMSTSMRRIDIIIDGLDECLDHTHDVLDILLRLHSTNDHGSLNLAVFSRDESIIRETLVDQFSHVEIEAHTDDIELYVTAELDRLIARGKLRIRNLMLRDTIIKRLITGAKGMFRWVACQLDHMCMLTSDAALKKALERLPPTLPETYERILVRIDSLHEDVRHLVERTLLIIASDRGRHLPLDNLCEAVSLKDDSETLLKEEIVDAEEILRWCGCLVRKHDMYDDGTGLEFAHFTVQEYLETICAGHPRLKRYSISEQKSELLLGKLFLQYLTLENHNQLGNSTEDGVLRLLVTEHPFYVDAAAGWQVLCENDIAVEEALGEHLRRLFHVQKTANFGNWAIAAILQLLRNSPCYRPKHFDTLQIFRKVSSIVLRTDFTPLHMASMLGLTTVCRYLLENGADPNLRSKLGTPYHLALGSTSVLRLYFQGHRPHGTAIQTRRPGTAIQTRRPGTAIQTRQETLQVLIEAGAQVDQPLITPNQKISIMSLPFYMDFPIRRPEDNFISVFEVAADLVAAGAPISQCDVEFFEKLYDDLLVCAKSFKAEEGRVDKLKSLLAAWEAQGDARSPKARLHSATITFCRKMDLHGLSPEFSITSLKLSASGGELYFVAHAIKLNDTASLEKLLNGGHSYLTSLNGLDPSQPMASPLHIAVEAQSLAVVRLLLDHKADPNATGARKTTPLHCCMETSDIAILRELLRHGASTILPDDRGRTVWHYAAESDSSSLLETLLESTERDHALQMQSAEGYTPICEALALEARTPHKTGNTSFLLKYCTSKEYWKSGSSIFGDACALGDARIIQALLAAQVPHDGLDDTAEGNPLHSLDIRSSVECVALLKNIYALDKRRTKDSKTPLEALLQRATDEHVCLSRDLVEVMIPETCRVNALEASRLWEFACKCVSLVRNEFFDAASYHLLLDAQIQDLFEQESHTSGLRPFAKSFIYEFKLHDETLIMGGQERDLPFATRWTELSTVVRMIAQRSRHLGFASTDREIVFLLTLAVIHRDEALIQVLLERGVSLHAKVDQLSPFEVACLPQVQIPISTFEYLISRTAPEQIYRADSYDGMYNIGPLYLTSGFGTGLSAPLKLQRLLSSGIDCNMPMAVANLTPLAQHLLHGATDTAMVLLDSGADPWIGGVSGFDAALAAAYMGNLPMLSRILHTEEATGKRGSWARTWTGKINGRSLRGASAIHLAVISGAVDSIQFYLDHKLLAGLEVRCTANETPMHWAAYFGKEAALRVLIADDGVLDATGNGGLTPLHYAAEKGCLGAVRVLVQAGANKHKLDNFGRRPIDIAYIGGHHEVARALTSASEQDSSDAAIANSTSVLSAMASGVGAAILRNDVTELKRILEMGCPVDIELFNQGQVTTPLGLVLQRSCDLSMVQVLLDANAMTSIRFPALHQGVAHDALEIAVRCPDLNSVLPQLLQRYMDEVHHLPPRPYTPLQLAVLAGNKRGARIILDQLQSVFTQHGSLTEFDTFVNHVSTSKQHPYQTALYMAASEGHLDICEMLVKFGADVDAKSASGKTPFHVAAHNGHALVAQFLKEKGALTVARDDEGLSAQLSAYLSGVDDIISLFPKLSISDTDISGCNSLQIMAMNEDEMGVPNIVEFRKLLDQGADICHTDLVGFSIQHDLLKSSIGRQLRFLLQAEPARLQIHRLPPWPEYMGHVDVVAVSKNLPLLKHALTQSEMKRVIGMVQPGDHSLVCQAAYLGSTIAISAFVALDPECTKHRCRKHGTPLFAALSQGQQEAAKEIVRLYDLQNITSWGEFLSCGSNINTRLMQWHFVGRFMERKGLFFEVANDCQVVRPWSGFRLARVPLKWEWRKFRYESMIEYAIRRQKFVSEQKGVRIRDLQLVE